MFPTTFTKRAHISSHSAFGDVMLGAGISHGGIFTWKLAKATNHDLFYSSYPPSGSEKDLFTIPNPSSENTNLTQAFHINPSIANMPSNSLSKFIPLFILWALAITSHLLVLKIAGAFSPLWPGTCCPLCRNTFVTILHLVNSYSSVKTQLKYSYFATPPRRADQLFSGVPAHLYSKTCHREFNYLFTHLSPP